MLKKLIISSIVLLTTVSLDASMMPAVRALPQSPAGTLPIGTVVNGSIMPAVRALPPQGLMIMTPRGPLGFANGPQGPVAIDPQGHTMPIANGPQGPMVMTPQGPLPFHGPMPVGQPGTLVPFGAVPAVPAYGMNR